MENYCLFTNDVEDLSIWSNIMSADTGKKVLNEGMPLLIDLYRKYNIKSTFYFTGHIAQSFPGVVKMILADGHEVASHGYSHHVDQAFDVLSYDAQVEHLMKSKKILEDIAGHEVISFRAPALRVNGDTPKALAQAGFMIDSSVASQRFDMFLSYGGIKKLKWLTAPRLPYLTQPDNLFKKGKGPIVEIPISALLFPYLGTTMRMFPKVTSVQQRLLHYETKVRSKPMVFLVHPTEFIDERTGPRVIARRSSNPLKYILNDVIRGKLKGKNLGPKGLPIYEKLIQFYIEKGYKFVTVKDYCKAANLIS